ncbi:MAG: radical SAM-associated putative lipoprotein [Dysgonomonas sp.]|nr:radical SAM-associated putative lipoprotein [Dysgonomonas sp.]
MKIKILTFYSKLLLFLLSLLGLQSCDDPVDEYGCPSAKYKVKGTIISQGNNEKIEGIRAVLVDSHNGEENPYYGDTVYTDSQGKFYIERSDIPRSEFVLKLQDIDEEKNGEFLDKNIAIDMKDVPLKGGDGNWYLGEATIDLGEVELVSKESSEKKQ